MTSDEIQSLLEDELAICSHNSEPCLFVLREILEIAELREEEQWDADGSWSIAELRLDATLPWHATRQCTLAWITSCGLIQHDANDDHFTLTERGGELLCWFRECEEAEARAAEKSRGEMN